MRRASNIVRRVGRLRVAAIIAAVAVGTVLIVHAGGQQPTRRASLSGVQRAIHIAVSEAVGVARGTGSRGGHYRRVVLYVPKAPARVYAIRLSGSAALARSYPRLEQGASASGRIRFVSVRGKSYGRVCWEIARLSSREPVTAGAIHQAPARLEGAAVINLARVPGAPWRQQGCTLVSSLLMIEVAHHTADFYVELDTVRHPDGALRGQL